MIESEEQHRVNEEILLVSHSSLIDHGNLSYELERGVSETSTINQFIAQATDETYELERGVSETSTINQFIAQATDETFKVNNVYDSVECLKLSAEKFAKEHHFEVRCGGKKIHCYRGFQSKHERDRERTDRAKKTGTQNRTRKSLMKCDCQWYLTFKQLPNTDNDDNNALNGNDSNNIESNTTSKKTMKIILLMSLAAIPALFLNLPVRLLARFYANYRRKKALAESRVKVKGMDVMLSEKVLLRIVLVPTLSVSYGLLLIFLSNLDGPVIALILWSLPLFSYMG